MSITTFAQVGDSRDNNFDFLRFLMASLVVYAHGFAFVNGHGYYGSVSLARLTHWNTGFGGLAVECFFLMSGYLVTRSWIYSKGWADYAKKRALRILPALAVVLLFCVFVVGPLATTLPLSEYFHNPRTFKYLALMFCHDFKTSDNLPGVFVNQPWHSGVDSSLWTIRYEAVCYVVVALLGLLQMYRKPASIMGLAIIVYALYFLNGSGRIHLGEIGQLFYLLSFFMVGMLLYLKRESIPYSLSLFWVCIVIIIAADLANCLRWVMPFAGGYALFYVAFSKKINLHHFAKRGDFSYGIYIYAFPVQQLVVHFSKNSLSPNQHFLVAMSITTLCAALSWHLVEQPFLRLKGRRQKRQEEQRAVENRIREAPVSSLPDTGIDIAKATPARISEETTEGA